MAQAPSLSPPSFSTSAGSHDTRAPVAPSRTFLEALLVEQKNNGSMSLQPWGCGAQMSPSKPLLAVGTVAVGGSWALSLTLT